MAQESSASPLDTASKIVVSLEQGKICEEQLVVASGREEELQKKLEAQIEIDRLKDEQITIYKNMVEMLNKTSEAKDKLHDTELKAAKPSFWQNTQKYATGAVGGMGLLGLILLFL